MDENTYVVDSRKEQEKRSLEKQNALFQHKYLSLGIADVFLGGHLLIDMKLCKREECSKPCIEVCSTNALYWSRDGKMGILSELCMHCGACVLVCAVENCMEITRKRSCGKVETLSSSKQVLAVHRNTSTTKRRQRVKDRSIAFKIKSRKIEVCYHEIMICDTISDTIKTEKRLFPELFHNFFHNSTLFCVT